MLSTLRGLRRSNHRLVEIGNGDAERILREVYEREQERQTCIVGVHWDYEFDDLVEIVNCFKGEALATLCKVMAQEYQQRYGFPVYHGAPIPRQKYLLTLLVLFRGGGIPDLFLWRVNGDERGMSSKGGREVLFAEVKSENDRLSDTQRLWIHVLTGAGIPVELCAAVAKEVRTVR